MATTSKREVGRDDQGRWKPGYMTHAELVSALRSDVGERRTALVAEAHKRMAYTDYPPFPADLNLGSRADRIWALVIETGDQEDEQQGHAARTDAGTTQQPGDPGSGGVPVDPAGGRRPVPAGPSEDLAPEGAK